MAVGCACLFIVAVSIALFGGLANGANDAYNAQEFGVLCRIWRLASKDVPTPNIPSKTEVDSLVQRVGSLFVLATTNDTLYAENQTQIPLQIREKFERIPKSLHTIVASGKLGRLYERAGRLAADISAARGRTEQRKGELETAFREAIYGASFPKGKENDINSETQRVFGAAYNSLSDAKNCGDTGASGGDYVGVSLVNDFFCLCVPLSDASETHVCANSVVQSAGGTGWNGASYAPKAQAEWALIQAACPDYKQNVTVEAIEGVLANFHAALGLQARMKTDTQGAAGFILGHVNTRMSNGCKSTESSGSICVNYRQRLDPKVKGGHPPGIQWEQKMQLAATLLRKIQEDEKAAYRSFQRLEAMTVEAEELFQETWDRVGLENGKNKNNSMAGLPQKTAAEAGPTPISKENQLNASDGKSLANINARLVSLISILLV